MSRLILGLVFFSTSVFSQNFDHAHQAWDGLLRKHVVLLPGAKSSQVRYAELAKDRAALKAYLDALSGVAEAEFASWSRAHRMAFLINAYNAFTVEKVLTRYPELRSIRDFGMLFGNPFKDEFFMLFGRKTSLDGIEHGMLRKKGAYDEPRVHFALNCASVGCPMLREEAYAGARLEAQLEDQTRRFLADRSRNRLADGRLELSRIFDWYQEDFAPLERFLARYVDLPGNVSAPVSFLEYDWTLNDSRSSSRR
ncbi:MAG: DUF547 domain-containing protein [Burkholderiales bacterium]